MKTVMLNLLQIMKKKKRNLAERTVKSKRWLLVALIYLCGMLVNYYEKGELCLKNRKMS